MKKFLLGSILLAGSLFATGTTLAVVDGETITDADANAFLAPIARGATFDSLPAEAKEKLVNQLIEKKLLTKQAKKDGIDKTPEFQEALAKLTDDVSLELWMKKAYDKVKVSDEDAQKYYNENKEKEFKQDESVHARHILLKDEAEAKGIIDTLSKSKTLKDDFIKVANEKSTGPSAKNGGDLGFFTKKQMVPEFSDAAFKLKEGEITKAPVKSQFGYHVIYVEDKKPAGYIAFADVKNDVIAHLKMTKFKDNTSEIAKELKAKAKIQVAK